MSIENSDRWGSAEDKVLSDTVILAIANGDSRLDAFAFAGERE